MEYLTKPLNITRQVTLLTTGAIFAAGVAAYVLAGMTSESTPPLAPFAAALAVTSAIGALIVGLIVRRKQRDLWLLAIAARKMGEGDLSTPIRTNGKVEEVYFLGKVLEQNRISIQRMVRELAAAKEWSDSQRSLQAYFLANISHEFRTPLAGMKVSLELLLDNLRAHQAPAVRQGPARLRTRPRPPEPARPARCAVGPDGSSLPRRSSAGWSARSGVLASKESATTCS